MQTLLQLTSAGEKIRFLAKVGNGDFFLITVRVCVCGKVS